MARLGAHSAFAASDVAEVIALRRFRDELVVQVLHRVERRQLAFSRRVLVASQYIAGRLRQWHPSVASPVEVVGGGADLKRFHPPSDRVALRRELLAHRPDFQQVIDLLVEKGDWGKPMPRGKGRGVAIHESYDSIVGMIAEVAVTNGEVRVERVVIACDCGVVVNPRGVETQLEGGMIYGLSAALFCEITIKNGRVEQGNFDTYPVVRYKDAPKTEVYISPTAGKRWGGVGEPGATMIQPAVTNAIFAATGKRLRSLPIRGQDLSGAA